MSRTFRKISYHYLRRPKHKRALNENLRRNPFRRPGSIPPTDYDDIPVSREAGYYTYVKRSLLRKKDPEVIAHKLVERYRMTYSDSIKQVYDIIEILERRGLLNANRDA